MVMVYLHKYVYWFIHCVGLSENGGCPWNSNGETQGLSLKFGTVPYLIDTTTPALLETWNFLLVGEVEAAFVKVDDLANSWRFEGWLILIHVNIQGEKYHVFARFIPMFTSYCYVYQTNCCFAPVLHEALAFSGPLQDCVLVSIGRDIINTWMRLSGNRFTPNPVSTTCSICSYQHSRKGIPHFETYPDETQDISGHVVTPDKSSPCYNHIWVIWVV